MYDAGDFDTLTTEPLLLAQMKRIAVRVVHKTLHLQNMCAMSQGPEETIRAYCSRLVGTAELCDLTVICSLATCTQKTSYRDQVVMQALLKGMHDKDIRTRVLSRTQNSELKELSEVVDYIAAEEASSASFSTLNEFNTIAFCNFCFLITIPGACACACASIKPNKEFQNFQDQNRLL